MVFPRPKAVNESAVVLLDDRFAEIAVPVFAAFPVKVRFV